MNDIEFKKWTLKHQNSPLIAKTADSFASELIENRAHYLYSVTTDQKDICYIDNCNHIALLSTIPEPIRRSFYDDIYINYSWHTYHEILELSIYNAYRDHNIQILKDGLHTYNRLCFGQNLTTQNGYNQSGSYLELIYAFADADIPLIKRYLPIELGLANSNTVPFFRVAYNLILALLHPEEKHINKALNDAKSYCSKRSIPKLDLLTVQYLIAIAEGNSSKASESLQLLAENYRKMTWLFHCKDDYLKYFGLYIYGLYYISYFIPNSAIFQQISAPKSPYLWEEFDTYTIDNSFKTGSCIIDFKGELRGLTRLFNLS